MKKTITLFAFLVISSVLACAQDIIVTNSAQRIEAKILEVSKTEIKYKEADNLEGPLFVLGTDEIHTIIYANGKVVLYDNDKPTEDKSEQERIAQEQAEQERMAREAAEQERIARDRAQAQAQEQARQRQQEREQQEQLLELSRKSGEATGLAIKSIAQTVNSYTMDIQNTTKYPYRINLDGNILGVVNPYKVQRFTIPVKTYGRMQAVQTSGYVFSPTIKEFVIPQQKKQGYIKVVIK